MTGDREYIYQEISRFFCDFWFIIFCDCCQELTELLCGFRESIIDSDMSIDFEIMVGFEGVHKKKK